jgi:hypothetical protein
VVSRFLVGAAVAFVTAIAIAAPSGADPGAFNDLSCGCPQTVSDGGISVTEQLQRGIQAGLTGVDPAVATQ